MTKGLPRGATKCHTLGTAPFPTLTTEMVSRGAPGTCCPLASSASHHWELALEPAFGPWESIWTVRGCLPALSLAPSSPASPSPPPPASCLLPSAQGSWSWGPREGSQPAGSARQQSVCLACLMFSRVNHPQFPLLSFYVHGSLIELCVFEESGTVVMKPQGSPELLSEYMSLKWTGWSSHTHLGWGLCHHWCPDAPMLAHLSH